VRKLAAVWASLVGAVMLAAAGVMACSSVLRVVVLLVIAMAMLVLAGGHDGAALAVSSLA